MEYRQHASVGVLRNDTYYKHVCAMTDEKLRDKSEIAEELAVRDMRIKELESQLAAMTKKADGFFDALQLAAKINAEGQAREQHFRKALEALQQGFPQTHQINAVIRHTLSLPQDDTALRQWGAKLLRDLVYNRLEGLCNESGMKELLRKADELEAGK